MSDIATLLDPEVAAALAAAPPKVPVSAATLTARRNEFAGMVAPLSDTVVRVDHETRPGGPIVRVHRPADAAGPLPCVYWMHSGGMVLGDRFQDDLRFDVWCPCHQMVAVSVEYRLAPETPYPGAIDDCHDGLRWVADNAEALGVDPMRIGIAGASAGGGLAAALALVARDRRTVPIAFQLLVYPMLDDRLVTHSSQLEMPVWTPSENAYGWRSYLRDRMGAKNVEPYAAPARATDLTGLPPAYLVVGALDGFVDETVTYAAGLIDAGIATDLRVYPGLPHGFDAIAPGAAASNARNADLNDWLHRALDQPPKN